MNQLNDALQYYQEETEIFMQLKDTYSENPSYLRGYSIVLSRIDGVYDAMNQIPKDHKKSKFINKKSFK